VQSFCQGKNKNNKGRGVGLRRGPKGARGLGFARAEKRNGQKELN